MLTLVTLLVLIWLLGWFAILFYYRNDLRSLWLEPLLKRSVLIIESDDWGVGSDQQAEKLTTLANLLTSFQDVKGNSPVVTLGLILAEPDFDRMRLENCCQYIRRDLNEPRYSKMLEAIRRGTAEGVFSLQLHGMEHYWPPSLMKVSLENAKVASWLKADFPVCTEELPSPLQSRWIDTTSLPSSALSEAEIDEAVADEIDVFKQIFDEMPVVVVPPTFIWNERVEEAWAGHGVKVIVTPGRRYESRDHEGRPEPVKGTIRNGQVNSFGISYVVRDDYFEPLLGHSVVDALSAMEKKTRLGRPSLLEMHRFNFVCDEEKSERSFSQLAELFQMALGRFPDLRFVPTAQLVEKFQTGDQDLIQTRFSIRLHYWLRRLSEISRLRKLAWLSGAIIPVWIVYRLSMPSTNEPSEYAA